MTTATIFYVKIKQFAVKVMTGKITKSAPLVIQLKNAAKAIISLRIKIAHVTLLGPAVP